MPLTASRQQSTELTEFDENLARRWLKKITVYKDKYTVEFKSGVSVDIGKHSIMSTK